MQQSRFWESGSSSASQDIPRVLKKTKVHYLTYNSPPNVSVLIYINPVHAFPSCFLRYILILYSRLHLGLPSRLFPSGFPTNIPYAFLFPYLPHDPPISYSMSCSHEKYFSIVVYGKQSAYGCVSTKGGPPADKLVYLSVFPEFLFLSSFSPFSSYCMTFSLDPSGHPLSRCFSWSLPCRFIFRTFMIAFDLSHYVSA